MVWLVTPNDAGRDYMCVCVCVCREGGGEGGLGRRRGDLKRGGKVS